MLEAMLAPKLFASKGKDPEQLLIDFDLYIKTVNNYLLAVEKDQASSKVKLATLQSARWTRHGRSFRTPGKGSA